MKSRVLLKEIPAGKFHSAIFTTFSINLYYLEQQVLPLLGSKGIHYVSILADSKMLSSHLENYGSLSQQRKRNYAINGIQSNGAFHPKLIFLAGPDSVMVLVGSGNLTSSGHGKNLEVWNSIFINTIDDAKFGFVIQAWNYLKELHADLGESANNKINSIEENCFILSANTALTTPSVFKIDEQNQISFHTNHGNNSIFSQVSGIIGRDTIYRITIMCPFHDTEGKFIQELYKRYAPREINVLIQAHFGALPINMSKQPYVHFFEWKDVVQDKLRQNYFHAKNIVLEGSDKNYLISGSANASIAAFGTLTIPPTNHESVIIYQSTQVKYLELLSAQFTSSTVDLSDYETQPQDYQSMSSSAGQLIFIKSAEKYFDEVSLVFNVKEPVRDGVIQLFDSKGVIQLEEIVSYQPGDHMHKISLPNGIALFCAQVSLKDEAVSNKQFITDINAFESTNPSPRNRSLNQIRKLIENGDFSTPKIIDYLNTIYRQKPIKKRGPKASTQENRKDDLPVENDDDIQYMSYAEIQERAKQIDNQEKAHHYIEYRGVRLWESIFSYLKESREKIVQAAIDEDETEDPNKSGGREEKKKPISKRAISKSSFKRLKDKVEKFLDSYHQILEEKASNPKGHQPSLIDLSMFLIMVEILLHLIGHKERIKEESEEEHLLRLQFSTKVKSWSNYLIEFVGMFLLWCSKNRGFKDMDSIDYRAKLERYKSMAFVTNICGLAVYNMINKDFDPELQKQWLTLNTLNSNLVFNTPDSIHHDMEEYISFIPPNVIEVLGEAAVEDEISNILMALKNNNKNGDISVGDIYLHPVIGYTYLAKVIQNPKNTFYKLFSPGYHWDDELGNYWNGYVYSIKDKRWLKSRKN